MTEVAVLKNTFYDLGRNSLKNFLWFWLQFEKTISTIYVAVLRRTFYDLGRNSCKSFLGFRLQFCKSHHFMRLRNVFLEAECGEKSIVLAMKSCLAIHSSTKSQNQWMCTELVKSSLGLFQEGRRRPNSGHLRFT